MIMKRVRAYWDLTRLSLGILAGLAAINGALFAALLTKQTTNLVIFLTQNMFVFIVGFLVAASIVSAAMALNDYSDYPIDKINNRLDRPLVRGDLTRREVLYLIIGLYLFGIILSILFFNLIISISTIIFALLSILYSYQSSTGESKLNLKKRGIIGNIIVSSSYFAPFLLGVIFWITYTKNVSLNFRFFAVVVLFIIGALFGTLGREILKGLQDVEGDRLHAVTTLAVTRGESFAKRVGFSLSAFGLAIFYLLAFLTFQHLYSLVSALTFLVLASVFLIRVFFILFLSPSNIPAKQRYKMVRSVTRLILWFVIGSLLLGTVVEILLSF